MSCLRDRLICNTALRTALLYKVAGDPSLTLDYNFLLNSGSAITAVNRKGPAPTYTGNGGTSMVWDENATLVSTTDNEPRFDHDPVTGAALGLLMEPVRTNLIIQSEDFDTTWTKNNGATVTANSTVAPDGNTTADTLIDDSASFEEIQHGNITVSNSQTYTFSVYVLKDAVARTTRFPIFELRFQGGTQTNLQIGLDTSDGDVGSKVNLGSGTIVDSGTIDADDYWRLWFIIANDASGNTILDIKIYPAGAASASLDASIASAPTGSIVAWGAQIELGAFLTSYIPTTTVGVERTKDVLSETDLGWLNASAGTLFVQARIPHLSAAERTLWSIDDGTATDRLRLYLDAAENGNFETVNSGDTDGASDGAAVIAVDTVFKLAGTYEDDSVIGYVDGTASAEDTSAGIPVTDAATTSRFGDDSAAGTPFNGYLQTGKGYSVVKSAAFVSAL